MGKLKLGSWLHSNSGSDSGSDGKKENRRSFSPFASRSREESTNNQDTTSAPEAEGNSSQDAAGPLGIVALAKKISAESEVLETYLKENGLPMPGFGLDSPTDFPKLPPEIQKSRQEIIFKTRELQALMRGPRESIRWTSWGFLDALSLQILNSYGIAKLFPIDSTTTLDELQSKTSLDPVNLARVLRHAMTNNIFRETSPGVISHTAMSRLLAEDTVLQDWVSFNVEDIYPASAKVLQALRTHPEATSLTRTGFNFANDTVDKEPMYVTFGKNPPRAKRMVGAMASLTGGEGYEVSHLVNNYDFSEVNAAGGTLIDVGGSHGFVCVDLGKKWDRMKFIVQELPRTVDTAPNPICDDESVASRISFMAHDFFKDQPVKDADVYFFRWIIHNYSDPYAISILKALVPALKPGAKIVINDHCLREPGSETPWDEKLMRSMDMVMLTLLNAHERTEAEFRALFEAASDGYVFEGVMRPKGCRMSIIEAVWDPKPKEVESGM